MLDADDHFTFTVVLKHLVGVGDVAMLIDQRITGVAPQKFDRHVELVFSPHAVACGGHFRAMIDSVGPGKDRNLGFYRVLQHRKPFDAQIPGAFAHAGITAIYADVTGEYRQHGDCACGLLPVRVALRSPALANVSRFRRADFPRQLNDFFRRNTGNLRGPLRRFSNTVVALTQNIGFIVRVTRGRGGQSGFVVADAVFIQKRFINKIFGNQHPGDCRRQRAIGTWANRQPLVFSASGSVVITRVNDDHPGVGALARLFDIVCHAAAAHTCFRGIIAKHHHQFCIGDIIRTVAVIAAEHIAHGRADLGGAVATVTAEIAAAGVHQAIRYVRIGNIAAVHAGTVKHMYRFVAVVLEDTFQVIADGIQRFIPTDTFEFAFSSFTNAFHRIFQAIGMIHPATNRTAAQAGAYLMVAIFIVARGI